MTSSLWSAPRITTRSTRVVASSATRALSSARDDGVPVPVDHGHRHLAVGQVLGDPEPVLQQQPHGQPWIVVRAHIGQLGERRPQHHARRRTSCLQRRHHARAQRLTEVDRPLRRVAQRVERQCGCHGVLGEPVLARAAGVPSVAAVVHQQHGEATPAQLGRQTRPTRPVATVAGCDEHGHAHVRVRVRRHEPRTQRQSVRGVQRDVASPLDHVAGRRDPRRVREVDQLSLQRRQHADRHPHEEQEHEPEHDPSPGPRGRDHSSWSR